MTYENHFSDQLRANLDRGPHYEPDAEGSQAPIETAVRLVAYYLPQFHPIPENDLWWGKGFTEWTNVSKALPQFVGHYQPRLPGELGFYDLRLVDTLRRQATLARKYGIYGFCFHYYWFGGKRLLEKPLDLLLQKRDIDLPFCICWANENWTRRWDGLDHEVLVAQSHSDEDDIAFAVSLEPVLRDPRYIRVKGRPLILLYRPGLLPNALATARRWRTHFTRRGYGDPYLVMVQAFDDEDPRLYGFDAAVELPPHRVGADIPNINSELQFFTPSYQGTVCDYEELARRAVAMPPSPFRQFRGVCPSWDNEARRPGRGAVFARSTPKKYENWLAAVCRATLETDEPSERLIFLNAWNEWAEGATLEPDRHFGYAYLNATARVLRSLEACMPRLRIALISHDAHLHGAQMLALHIARSLVQDMGAQVRVLLGGPGELEEAFSKIAPTERIEGGFANPVAWEAAGCRLRADGFSAVLCNTLVSAQAIEPLCRSGLRVIVLVHELPTLIRAYGLVGAARTVARRGEITTVFASGYVRDRFVEIAGETIGQSVIRPQGVFLPPAPDSERVRQRTEARSMLGAGPDDLVVMGVGYGDHRKGFDMWPELIQRVLSECANALFVWVGLVQEPIASNVRMRVDHAGTSDRLRLPGNVRPLQPMYAAADIFVLTSREDPFPNVVLEAMAHGLSVVAFEGSGGITELLCETGCKLVPFEDIDAMAREVVRLLRDEGARISIGTASAHRIARDFRFRDYVSSLLALARGGLHTVSVVVPNYNYARFLRQRMESIWSQTHPIHEVILIDDASTDESATVIAELVNEARGRLRVVRNDVNSGAVSRQWARGVELATGELVWIAEADDFADSAFLSATAPAFDEPDIVLSYTQSRQISDDGHVIAENYLDYVADVDPALWRADHRRLGTVEIAEALSVKNTIPNVSAVVFRRADLARVLQDHRQTLTSYRSASDWFCYLHLLTSGSIAFNQASLNNHRRHGRSVTHTSNNEQHLREIRALQCLAAELVSVPPHRIEAGRAWYKAVARTLGVPLEPEDKSAAVPAPQPATLSGPITARDAWLEVVCAAYEGHSSNFSRSVLPGFPPSAIQVATTGQAGRATLKEAHTFYVDCVETFERLGRPIKRDDKVLDFGIGWGRIGRFFLNEIDPSNLYGIDVDPGLVSICRQTFAEGQFQTCQPMPPAPLPERHFDFIIGYSVFSHLSEAACRAWMKEYHRLLVPGGIAALTTRGRWYFDFCASLRDRTAEGGYIAALSHLFPDVEKVKRRYDAGELVFATSPGVSGGGVLDSSFYGETFIPEPFAARAFLPYMKLAEFQFDHARQTHPILFFRRGD